MKAAQLKAHETAFTSAGKHEPVIFSLPTHDPCRYTSVQHMMVMHSAHVVVVVLFCLFFFMKPQCAGVSRNEKKRAEL